jgi:hypothetical protein
MTIESDERLRRNRQVIAYLTDGEREKLRTLARTRDVTESALLRGWILRELREAERPRR